MRALVVGGDSNIARALCTRLLERGHGVVKTTRRNDPDAPVRHNERIIQFDMLRPELPQPFDEPWIDIVLYIMAAVTGVVPAETNPDAWRVNAEGPLQLAAQARGLGWHVVFMSSGTVERAPHTASAHQKTYVEGYVLASGGCVVRPLPFVKPEKYFEVAALLVEAGERRRVGVVRWEG